MSSEKSLFEQLGGTYTEGADGLLYPNLSYEEETESQVNAFAGKFGGIWKDYLKENHSYRYHHLIRMRKLRITAIEVNEEANEMLDTIMSQYLRKHRPDEPSSIMEMWRIREQAKAVAEEVVLHDIVYCYH